MRTWFSKKFGPGSASHRQAFGSWLYNRVGGRHNEDVSSDMLTSNYNIRLAALTITFNSKQKRWSNIQNPVRIYMAMPTVWTRAGLNACTRTPQTQNKLAEALFFLKRKCWFTELWFNKPPAALFHCILGLSLIFHLLSRFVNISGPICSKTGPISHNFEGLGIYLYFDF